MILGIPTLCRYDLLAELIESVEKGTVRPSEYFIVDNGGQFVPDLARERIKVLSAGRNLGVSRSWNEILMYAHSSGEPAVISNDDIVFNDTTFEELCSGLQDPEAGVVNGHGWSLFGQTKMCTDKVGFYDENFFPAYHEDCDYHWRMRLLDVKRLDVVTTPVAHVGSATLRSNPNLSPDSNWFQKGQMYYMRKWGGLPGKEQFREPFNGKPPNGWKNER